MARRSKDNRPRTVTGIEYTDRYVRIATLSVGRSGKISIRGLSQSKVVPGRPGVAEDMRAARIHALRDAQSKHIKDLGDVVVGIPRESVITRLVSLPSTEAREIREMLMFDVERHLPFPAEEAEISYRTFEQVGSSESRVLMVAARQTDLYGLLEELDECDIQPLRMDVDALGCGYCFVRNAPDDEEVFAVFHLGMQSSIAALVVRKQLRITRNLPDGLEKLEREVMPLAFNTPMEEWPPIQRQWWTNLTRNLVRTLTSFSHDEFGSTPTRLILSGSAQDIPGLSEALSRELNLPVESVLPLEPGKQQEPVAQYATSIGLALEEIELQHHINLIPEEIYQQREVAHRKQFAINVVSLLLINIVLLGLWVGHAFWHKKQVMDIFMGKIAEIQPMIAGVDSIADKLAVVSQNIDRENSAFKVIEDLFNRTRDRVRLSRLEFTKSNSVILDIETYTDRDLDEYLSDLSQSPYFSGNIERGQSRTRNLKPAESYLVTSTIQVTNIKCLLKSGVETGE